MLQQTRMEVVLRYYSRFLTRFPTIAELAAASADDVTAAWSGLGYYRRARMLREGAIAVRDRFDGKLPRDVEQLETIPGIGRYTAGAIASIGYDRSAPIVDGNVARILARLFGNARDPWNRATELVEAADSPRVFNQALMEIGALICRPKNPLCNRCPLRGNCRAYASGRTALAPRRQMKTRRLQIRLLIIKDRRGWILMRRESGRMFNGMFVLPRGPWSAVRGSRIGSFNHTITNRRITFIVFTASHDLRTTDHVWVDPKDLENFPHPSFVRKALHVAGLI